MYQERSGQTSFWGDPLYERIIPSDHILRKLAEVINFKEVNEKVKDLYCKDNGRPCHEPALLFKMIFLQFMYNISDREIEEQVRYNMAYKWFVGLSADEPSPDHSTLSVFRERLGAERFAEIFNWVVETARAKGFVSERLHVIDSTHILAKVDIIKFAPGRNKERGKDDDPMNSHPDQDARWGYKKKDKPFFGYKMHVGMDADSSLITKVSITPGNRHDNDEFFNVADDKADGITADKAYDAYLNHYLLAKDKKRDLIYRKKRENKRVCERSWIERKFSECKGKHGLRLARYWGLIKLKIQGYMTAIVTNIKQMARLTAGPPNWLACKVVH